MSLNQEFNDSFPDKALANHFVHAGDNLDEEAQILGKVVRSLTSSGIQLTNKNIICQLIKMLESTEDFIQIDVIRITLEIVVGYTSDDF